MQTILSILICHIFERAGMLGSMLRGLQEQIDRLGVEDKVEILVEADNREKTTGAKRNILLSQAAGKYIIFADEDDLLPDYYIEELLKAAETDCDCMAICGVMTTDGQREEKWYISKDNPYQTFKDEQGRTFYRRYTNHITAVKREIALKIGFPPKTFGEDFEYATALKNSGLLLTETAIEKPMYHYRFISKRK